MLATLIIFFFSGMKICVSVFPDCPVIGNNTYNEDYTDFDNREDCIYKYLVNKEIKNGKNTLFKRPPPAKELKIQIEGVSIRNVQLIQGTSYQFNIHGYMNLMWEDDRLKWDAEQWGIEQFYVRENHQIWSPNINYSNCINLCDSKLTKIEVFNYGQVYALFEITYVAYCFVNYRRFPEDENDCCISFSAHERDKNVTFVIGTDKKIKMNRPVSIQSDITKEMDNLIQEHSAWTVDEHSLEVTHLMHSIEVLKLCVHAEKKMGTIKMALRIPITVATLIMLVSPLFGDLRTQLYVKLFILCQQTLCFIYLCSVFPPNGFAGTRPKIYVYYELIFMMSSFSLLLTLGCIALSRMKRTIAPSHRFYLAAKLVNRVVCCIEPDQSNSYQRYLEESENQRPSSEPDATQEWRHVYLAINNMVSGMFFSMFIVIVLFYWF